MKVLIVAERYYPEVGAAPTRLANMAEGMNEQGLKVDVLTCLPNYPKGRIYDGYRYRIYKHETINGCNVFRYWAYATVSHRAISRALSMVSFAITMWLFAFRIKRCCNYDRVIIQTPALIPAVSAIWLFKLLYRRKCLLNVSDIWPSTAVDIGAIKEGSRSWKVMAWCERYLYLHADGIIGQSNEILERVDEIKRSFDKCFLYRNLPRYNEIHETHIRNERLKICFAGMLGVAQDILSIIQQIDFKALNVEFHIVGGGGQYEDICKWIKEHPNAGVEVHGFVTKDKMPEIYKSYDAAIVPLMTNIRGAFPSKVYDILPVGLPMLLCGEGEVARFVTENGVGLVSKPGDFTALRNNIIKLRNMPLKDFQQMSSACITTAHNLDFDKQMKEFLKYIKQEY